MDKEELKDNIDSSKILEKWKDLSLLEKREEMLDFRIERYISTQEIFDQEIDPGELEDQLLEVLP